MGRDEPARTGLVKVRVDLPPGQLPGVGGEALWAEPLGGDLYRLRNTPFHALDLNFYDVVRAVPEPDGWLCITEVVRRSGHRTLRVVFDEQASDDAMAAVLDELDAANTRCERADRCFFALDVEPEGDYAAVCDRLRRLQQSGLLEYETATLDESA